jgi:hypothetical protein
MRKHCLTALAVVLLFGCTQNQQHLKFGTVRDNPISSDHLIVPGQSIGDITLNENADSVFKILGKPDSSDAAMGKMVATWIKHHDTTTYETQVFFSRQMGVGDEASRVKEIRVTGPDFKTANYLGTGVTMQSIIEKYNFNLVKAAQYMAGSKRFFIFDDVVAGISFEVNNKRICTGIIVHTPNENSTAQYLAFHTHTK